MDGTDTFLIEQLLVHPLKIDISWQWRAADRQISIVNFDSLLNKLLPNYGRW